MSVAQVGFKVVPTVGRYLVRARARLTPDQGFMFAGPGQISHLDDFEPCQKAMTRDMLDFRYKQLRNDLS